jgi:hypothetical protein
MRLGHRKTFEVAFCPYVGQKRFMEPVDITLDRVANVS